jgi:hypothetical protein
MEYKGVSYDVGRVMWGNWRPVFDAKVVNRELEIIRNDLHCNAVRICGLDIGRLMIAAELALKQEPRTSSFMHADRVRPTLRFLTEPRIHLTIFVCLPR